MQGPIYEFQATAAVPPVFTPKATGKGIHILSHIYTARISWAVPFKEAHIQTLLISFLFFYITKVDSNAS